MSDAPDATPDDATSVPVPPVTGSAPDVAPGLDLDAIERDLAGVEAALRRLDDGSYWTDEVSGKPIPDDVLTTNPVARRAE